ncbi:MAG: transglycosylase SLT domain-containing protein [Burkholderiales bacterium]|nr:transglycosylase SLT domain-containing protein [Burkholderiales bacterium]
MMRLSKLGLVIVALGLAFTFPAYSWEPLQPNTIKSATFNDGDIYTVWHRIRDGFGVPDMDNEVVDEQIAFYKSKPDYLQRMANRSAFYLYHIIEEVQAQNMPTEIALLPFVESAFVTKAKSRVKAAGLWQFMPSTGKIFSLDQNLWKDERNDVLQSTTAAMKYLKKLYAEFGDWQLALAGYNWGEGNIRKQIKKNQTLGLPTDYMSLTMPEETRKYYPKLQAIKDIVLNPQKYGVKLPLIYDEPFLVQIYKEQDIDIATAAKLAKMNDDDFNTLNPSFNRPVIVASHNNYMLLPADRIDGFVENLVAWRTSGKPLSSWTTYRVKPGETIASIAQKANMS